jgi:molecular chaperone IbpA
LFNLKKDLTMTTFDSVYSTTLGFDKLFYNAETFFNNHDKYPHHNIVKVDDLTYKIELALAGFTKEDVSVDHIEGTLHVKGGKDEQDKVNYLHKGIGSRRFHKSFRLADTIEVKEATFNNGILIIELYNNLPIDKQPKHIKVN